MIRLVTPALLVLALFTTSANALEITQMSAAERAIFRAEVRAYLMENPEVILEAVKVLEDRQAVAKAQADYTLVANNTAALFDDGFSFVGGNPDGDISMVTLGRIADGLGLDREAILAEMDSDATLTEIARTRALANQLNISGTPTFVLQDELLRGFIPADQMALIVGEKRANR